MTKPFKAREPTTPHLLSIQVAPDDCTGCGVCVEQCPAVSKSVVGHKAINMEPVTEHRDRERVNYDFFKDIPMLERGLLGHDTVKGSQVLQPLFEFSSACEGCGETPYLRLLSQLFGDRMIVANATGCSSIYGGNLPTTPWTTNAQGRGPAWSNSLFEDNAEFGLGMRLGIEQGTATARALVSTLAEGIGAQLAGELARRGPVQRGGDQRPAGAGGASARAVGHAAGRTLPRPPPVEPDRLPGAQRRVDHRW